MFFWVWHSKAVLQTWRGGRVGFGHGIDRVSSVKMVDFYRYRLSSES